MKHRTKLCLTSALLSFAFGAAIIGFTADRSDAATVERHAICWKGTAKVAGKHWRVWNREKNGWDDTRRPCKHLWRKAWAVIRDGRVIGIHNERTLVEGLPDPQAGLP
jgi:hypothetical protein